MNNSKELVIITGLSGAGKSTAMGFMEDIGYYCIDYMPPVLLGTFLELISKREEYSKVAIVIDIRSTDNFSGIIAALDELENTGYDVKIVYLDIKTHVALKRYKLTRRKHPYADRFNGDIAQALAFEREAMAPLRSKADFVIDSSDLTGNQLRTRLTQILVGDDKDVMNIHVESSDLSMVFPQKRISLLMFAACRTPIGWKICAAKRALIRKCAIMFFRLMNQGSFLIN